MTHSPMSKSLEEIAVEVAAWGRNTFPGDTFFHVQKKFKEEAIELDTAVTDFGIDLLVLDEESPSLRKEVIDEAADCAIVLMRLADLLGFDLRKAVEDKWAIVKTRNYGNNFGPEGASDDHRTIIGRSSDDHRPIKHDDAQRRTEEDDGA